MIYESAAETAKKIRTALKAGFPSVKFSVRSKSYSGGSSVDVHWTDGPMQDDVDAVLARFSSASFDGMQDLKTSHGYEYEGQIYNGADWVHGQRELSPELRARVEAKAGEMFDDFQADHWMRGQRMAQAEAALIEEARIPENESFRCGQCGSSRVTVSANDGGMGYCEHCPEKVNVVPVAADPGPVDGVTMTLNDEKQGIEIRFAECPPIGVRLMLKENGFRWSRRGFWYAKQTPERLTLAKTLQETEQGGGLEVAAEEEPEDAPAYKVTVSDPYGMREVFTLSGEPDENSITAVVAGRHPDRCADFAYAVGPNEYQYVGPIALPGWDGGDTVPMLRVLITWSECPLFEGGEFYTTWAEANAAMLRGAAHHGAGGGYYKTGFLVAWADGHTYEGRIDLNDKDSNLSEHIRQHCEAHVSKPAHMTQESWDGYMQFVTKGGTEDVSSEFRKFLDRYSLVDDVPSGPKPGGGKLAEVIQFRPRATVPDAPGGAQFTPGQRLMIRVLREMIPPDMVEGGLDAGLTPEQLMETAGAALESQGPAQ